MRARTIYRPVLEAPWVSRDPRSTFLRAFARDFITILVFNQSNLIIIIFFFIFFFLYKYVVELVKSLLGFTPTSAVC